MNPLKHPAAWRAFSLVEVVVAIGIVGFVVISTFGLLSVATDTNKRARDEQACAQLAQNEFQRIRSLSFGNFPTTTYIPRYYDSDLKEVAASPTPPPNAIYKFQITIVPSPGPPAAASDFVFNADVIYPANAAAANQKTVRFTSLMNLPP